MQVGLGARKYVESKKADLRRQFELFDTDASGDLSIEELLIALDNYGYQDFEQATIFGVLEQQPLRGRDTALKKARDPASKKAYYR